MKTFALILVLALLALPALAGEHAMATKSGWFDLEHCDFCKNLLKDPELLHHMTWETHKIDNGMMYISTCDPAYAESYAACNAAMEKLGNDMMTGAVDPTTVQMCGSCAAFGELMMAGVTMENIDGEAADISLVTSSDAEMVDKLHAYADRNNKEMDELMASSGGHGDHPAH
jgi:hypothetical protein